MGEGVYLDYVPGVGYELENPAFPGAGLLLMADIDAQPADEPDQQ
jgi:hypothetical protein